MLCVSWFVAHILLLFLNNKWQILNKKNTPRGRFRGERGERHSQPLGISHRDYPVLTTRPVGRLIAKERTVEGFFGGLPGIALKMFSVR